MRKLAALVAQLLAARLIPKRSLLLLLATALLAPLPALADTVTIGYFDPAANMPGIQIIGTTSGPITTTSPTVQLLGGLHSVRTRSCLDRGSGSTRSSPP